MNPRTIHCANAVLYAAITLLVVAATVYVWCTEPQSTRSILASAAAAGAVIWALHYIFLRYRIDAEGVSEHGLLRRTKSIRWSDVTEARLEELQLRGIAGLTIIIQSPDTTITISSNVLSMEAVEELAEELKKAGILA